MHLVYITEPAWFENAIPGWVRPDLHTVVTDSDSVVNQAVVKGIEVLAMGKYFPSEKACESYHRSIVQESSLRKNLAVLLHPEGHLSEMIHGISYLIYACDRHIYAMRGLLDSCIPSDVTFVYGDRYRASVVETPRGGVLEYLFLSRECRTRGIRMKKTTHELMSKREVTESTRYDRYLSECTDCCDVKAAHNKLRAITHKKQENALFLYMYEMCKDDLEALASPERWPENCGILTGKLSKYAPESISYDFDFSNTVAVNDETYGKSYHNFRKSVDMVLSEFFGGILGEFPSIKELINYQTKQLRRNFRSCCSIIESMKDVISKHDVKFAVITGYSGPTGAVIASYLAAQGVEVTIRQHGGLGEPHWPDKCALEGCYFSANSEFYKNNLSIDVIGCDVVPRDRKCSAPSSKIEDAGGSKYILVTDDQFINPANKILQIKFFTEFINTMPSEWSIVMRAHPRNPGNLLPGLSSPRVTRENARYKDITSSLKNACVLVCPIENFSTVSCDAIMAGVPTIVVAPEGSMNVFDYKPYAYGYPMIVSQPPELIDIISQMKSDTAYVNDVLTELNTWMDAVLGKPAEIHDTTEDNCYALNQGATAFDVSSVKYIKMLCRAKIKLLINRWHMFWSARTI
ncbi:MAG: hypothetical protein V2A66_00105 [Pseudomonadota bacterium]